MRIAESKSVPDVLHHVWDLALFSRCPEDPVDEWAGIEVLRIGEGGVGFLVLLL